MLVIYIIYNHYGTPICTTIDNQSQHSRFHTLNQPQHYTIFIIQPRQYFEKKEILFIPNNYYHNNNKYQN